MTSFVTFILYTAVITAIVLIVAYFTGTTSTRTRNGDRFSEPFPARRIRESA